MKVRVVFLALLLSLGYGLDCFAQTSRIVSWRDPDQRAYEPVPVIFVHGFAADSSSWGPGIANFQPVFALYSQTNAAPTQPGMVGQPGAAYLETFDYGRYGADFGQALPRGHQQTFDSIRMNAVDGVFGGQGITLSNRIDGVRTAYQVQGRPRPPVILNCHSTGSILSHYYLTECVHGGINPGVARLATRGAPHYGSTWANFMRSKYRPDAPIRFILIPKTFLFDTVFLGTLFEGFEKTKDFNNMRRYANPPRAQPEKLVMTDFSTHRPNSNRRSERNSLTFEESAL